jgi:hypothetical protein
MPDASQLLADQAMVFADFPIEDLTIGSATYSALVLQWREGNSVEFGGFSANVIGKLAIERSAVETMPTRGQDVTFRGTAYRLGEVDSSDAAASVTLDLEELTKA